MPLPLSTLRIVVVLLGVFAVAARPAEGFVAPSAVTKKVASARQRASAELLKLATACARAKAFDAAERHLRRAAALALDDQKVRRQQRAIAGEVTAAAESFEAKLEKLRVTADLKCVRWLADAAVLARERNAPAAFEEAATLLMEHFPRDQLRGRLEVEFFEPYLCWTTPDAARRYAAGEEWIEGDWRDAEAVAALDASHATWATRWKLEDDVHRVESRMPFRTVRRVLAYVGVFRRFFLAEFADEWDLRAPRGKLPVILTETQAEHQERLREVRGDRPVPPAAGLYVYTDRPLSPCFLTFEVMLETGRTARIGFDVLGSTLKHEVSHQIAFEYSRHGMKAPSPDQHHYWCVEGIANYVEYFVLDDGRWRLSSPKILPAVPGKYQEGSFAYCRENLRRLPSLEQQFAMRRDQLDSTAKYHMAATTARFLLSGEGGKYRASFMRLLEAVHQWRGSADVWARCFGDVGMNEMQAEWETFVKVIPIE